MKFFGKILSIVSLSALVISSVASASVNPSSPPTTEGDLNSLKGVHQYVVEHGYASLNPDGTISVNTNAIAPVVEPNLLNQYIKSLDGSNDVILATGDAIKFDENFELQVGTQEEIIESVTKVDQMNSVSNDSVISIMSDPDTPPYLNAYYMANQNRNTVKNYYDSLNSSIWVNARDAYTATVGMWVAKVQPGGVWDYKSVPYYYPARKLWTARVKNGTELRTSEWFGNYNYGFTGKELFNLPTLLTAGDAVGLGTSFRLDDDNDKNAVRQGYNESP
ncbi:polymorphic toxin type 44 domain-containing protein [Paenibacillus sp. RRE4]|uniref:polymorphic toxin type 44 domain-containing protein n=1 Tax=Paenibacillus TaxID=44249 RepID=UPI0011A6B02C|nr:MULTISPECIES: polymorphic toxin type 44 domain-containing protein [Paenibacillus]MDT0121553.1 polymorphic toxin type 44 domain-containing protein [Paenibacillus sp. RRE4]